MNKQQKQYIMLGGLVLVLAVVVIFNFRPAPKKTVSGGSTAPQPAEAIKPPTRQVISTPSVAEALATPKEREEQMAIAEKDWGLDPFYHALSKDVYTGSNLMLKGVSIGKDKPGYAFINDEIVSLGDIIYGYKVAEVQKNKVLLERGPESFYLVLPEQ